MISGDYVAWFTLCNDVICKDSYKSPLYSIISEYMKNFNIYDFQEDNIKL